jgi:hypothetical protein
MSDMHARVYVQTQQNSLRGKNILRNALQQSDRNLAEADDGNYLQPRASGVVLQFKCKHLRGMLAVSRSATLGTILDPNRELYKKAVAMVLVRAALPHGQGIADELHIMRHNGNSPALRFPRMGRNANIYPYAKNGGPIFGL